jgi:hypothetical protein
MNRDAKNIRTTCRPQIDNIKLAILTSAGRWFDIYGHAGTTALRELRRTGHRIEYNRTRASYRLVA